MSYNTKIVLIIFGIILIIAAGYWYVTKDKSISDEYHNDYSNRKEELPLPSQVSTTTSQDSVIITNVENN